MPLPGDPWLRIWCAWRRWFLKIQSLVAKKKQHLPHEEPIYTEEGEVGHVKDLYLRVQNNSGLHSSCFPVISYMITICPDPVFLAACVGACSAGSVLWVTLSPNESSLPSCCKSAFPPSLQGKADIPP